jgi:hypothetical protein
LPNGTHNNSLAILLDVVKFGGLTNNQVGASNRLAHNRNKSFLVLKINLRRGEIKPCLLNYPNLLNTQRPIPIVYFWFFTPLFCGKGFTTQQSVIILGIRATSKACQVLTACQTWPKPILGVINSKTAFVLGTASHTIGHTSPQGVTGIIDWPITISAVAAVEVESIAINSIWVREVCAFLSGGGRGGGSVGGNCYGTGSCN